MNDETNNAAQALAARANQVETEGKDTYGEHAWGQAVKSIERKMAAGELTQIELQQALAKSNAASQIFNNGIAEAPESEWRAWRDRQPRRAERIRRTER